MPLFSKERGCSLCCDARESDFGMGRRCDDSNKGCRTMVFAYSSHREQG